MITDQTIQRWFGEHAVSAEQHTRIRKIRQQGELLCAAIYANAPRGGDQDAAMRRVREAVMTAVDAIETE